MYNIAKVCVKLLPADALGKKTRGTICLSRVKRILSAVLAGLLLLNSSLVLNTAAFMNDSASSGSLPEEVIPWDDVTVPWEELEKEEETEPEDFEETEPDETESDEEPEETESEETESEDTEDEDTESDDEELDEEESSGSQNPRPSTPVHSNVEYKTYNSVPLYFQNDYPDTMFGSGTVATSGCSITCLAMVATYMTGHEFFPDELAGYFGGRAENNLKRMLYGMQKMRLPYKQCADWNAVMDDLIKGKVVILLVNRKSIFTDTQHFVVLTGLTKDGKILVNDTNCDNYDRWDLKEKLITGFPESDLWRGFDGAWSFDKKAMPAEPYIYHEEEVYVEPRYVGVTLTMDERELLARMVWVEARGEPFEGQQAVAEVVLNRLVAENFQNSVESIIMAEGQFNSARFLDDAEPNQTQYEAVERALKGPYITPINTVYFGRGSSINGSPWKWIGGHCFCTQWLPKD